MSREEIEEEHVTIIKGIYKAIPYIKIACWVLGMLFTLMCTLGAVIIKGYNYDATLIKRTEFDNHTKVESRNAASVSRSLIIDSTVNRVQDQRLDKLETTKSTRVTAARDNNGVHFNPVN